MKFSIGKTFLLGFGFFGVSVIWSVYNAYVPIFLQDRFLLAVGFIGIFMTLDNIAALLIQPAVGAWSDRIHTRLGRRLPFILVGAPIAALAFIMLPLAGSIFAFFLASIALLISMAVWRTPVVALMPDITPSKYRSQANGIINLMGGLGAIIAFIGGAKLYDMNPEYPFLMGAVLVLLAAILVLIFIHEPKIPENTEEEKPGIMSSIKTMLNSPDRSEIRLLSAIFFWFVAYAGIEAFFTLFTKNYLLLPESDGARMLGQLSLLFVIFAIPAGYIGSAVGRKKTIISGVTLMMLGVAAIFFIPRETLATLVTTLPLVGPIYSLSFIMMLLGVAWALININSLPMVVDMTDAVHIGTYTGLYYLFSTLAAIIGPILYGGVIQASGGNYNLLMIISPIFLLFALLAMLGVKRGEAQDPSDLLVS
jgi:maltose/moltooligosaccharide transporter